MALAVLALGIFTSGAWVIASRVRGDNPREVPPSNASDLALHGVSHKAIDGKVKKPLVDPGKVDKALGDLAKLQGHWLQAPNTGNRSNAAGKVPEDPVFKLVLSFDGPQFLLRDRKQALMRFTGGNDLGRVKLDGNQKPKGMDLTIDATKKKVAAIYEFEGDLLKLCLGAPGDERPTEFKTTARYTLLILQQGDPCK
jgi:uncharacterized protein (TIGR03067 family)